jgi:beta-lactamase class D
MSAFQVFHIIAGNMYFKSSIFFEITMNKLIFMLIFGALLHSQTLLEHPEFKRCYDDAAVAGSFFLWNPASDSIICYNKAQFDSGFIPASTFKICNSLIALETGMVKDEYMVIPWDSVQRSVPEWNADTDMKTAFKNSTVWFYQSLAIGIGSERMHYWIDKLQYGNRNISGRIDEFWLKGKLRITPHQQLEFVKKLHDEALPLSARTMKIVKSIMLYEKTSSYNLFAKTGWSVQDSTDIGWWVGFIEKNNQIYYFVNCVQCRAQDNPNFAASRKKIVYEILKSLHIISKQ